jgi:small-conductance mechanosensitive channel
MITLAISVNWDRVAQDAGRLAIVAVLATVVALLIQRLITPLVRVAISEQMVGEPDVEVAKRIDTLSHVVYRTALVIIFIVAILMVLPIFGLSVSPLIAGVGIIGIAVGFGAQYLVRDVLNGVFILMENQYGRGDVVSIGGISGLVEDLNLRRTVLRDLDGTVHFVPHGQVEITSNLTKGFSRINLDIGVSYSVDLDHAFNVINRVGRELAEDPAFTAKIVEAPQALRVDDFADSSIVIKVLGVTAPIEQWAVAGEFRKRLKKAFDEEGIEIPFPQRTVHTTNGFAPGQKVATD